MLSYYYRIGSGAGTQKFRREDIKMNIGYRILICLGIIILHFAAFAIPVTELFVIYIILFNPRWFREMMR